MPLGAAGDRRSELLVLVSVTMASRVWTRNVFFPSSSTCTWNAMFGICFETYSGPKGRRRGDGRVMGETGTTNGWWPLPLAMSLWAAVTRPLCGLLRRLEIFTVRVNNKETFVPHVQANMAGTQDALSRLRPCSSIPGRCSCHPRQHLLQTLAGSFLPAEAAWPDARSALFRTPRPRFVSDQSPLGSSSDARVSS